MASRPKKRRLPAQSADLPAGQSTSDSPARVLQTVSMQHGVSPDHAFAAKTSRSADLLIGLLLVLAVFLVFGQTTRFDFISFDDPEYVSENRQVQAGLNLQGVHWAFTHFHTVNWHPLTTLSHMLDCQIYGLWPGGHHLTNVILHALTAVILYATLRQMTHQITRSAFVAMLFAIHPLRAESVAWVAERKDVLSGLFFVLVLAAYLRYVRKPTSLVRYLLLPLVSALGLLCKPMLVTLPFVLLLLDYWPLGRVQGAEGSEEREKGRKGEREETATPRSEFSAASLLPAPCSRPMLPTAIRPPPTSITWLLIEKLPLVILAACFCAITLIAQSSAMPPLRTVTTFCRIGNCLLSYTAYLRMFLWPSGLAVYYPYPASPPSTWAIAGSSALLAVITCLAWTWRRKHPYVIVGWLWYLGMLIPVIGLIQVGYQAMADRYTYLPLIGPGIAIVWLIADFAAASVNRRFVVSVIGSLGLIILAVWAARQTGFWRDSRALWMRAASCTSDNYVAYNNLGNFLASGGQFTEAAVEYNKALRIEPNFPEAHYDLAIALAALNKDDEARWQYEKALDLRSNYSKAHNNLGMLLLDRGKFTDAADHFQKALDGNPDFALAHNNLGIALMEAGRPVEAVAHYRKAIELSPDLSKAHANLGHLLAGQGRSAEAVVELRTFLSTEPDNPLVLGWLAWVLATASDDTVRDGGQAVELAQQAARYTNRSDASVLDALAAAYAETGRFQEAVETATTARNLATATGVPRLATEIQQRIELYSNSKPFRQIPQRF